jgi:hypothetical protein
VSVPHCGVSDYHCEIDFDSAEPNDYLLRLVLTYQDYDVAFPLHFVLGDPFLGLGCATLNADAVMVNVGRRQSGYRSRQCLEDKLQEWLCSK